MTRANAVTEHNPDGCIYMFLSLRDLKINVSKKRLHLTVKSSLFKVQSIQFIYRQYHPQTQIQSNPWLTSGKLSRTGMVRGKEWTPRMH